MLKGKGKWPFSSQSHTPVDQLKPPPTSPIYLSPDSRRFGLENFGNTCYANSVLQALYFCAPFRDLLIQTPDPSVPAVGDSASLSLAPTPQSSVPIPPAGRRKPERKLSSSAPDTPSNPPTQSPLPSNPPGLFSALRSLYLYISANPAEKGTVGPRAFIDKVKDLNVVFRSPQHQDAHEFLNYLLNRIVEEIESAPTVQEEDLSNSVGTLGHPRSTSGGCSSTFVHKIFEGVLTSETRCLTCETVSSRDESFLDLSIDIEQNTSVTACLRQFSASEMLSSKNKFFCDSCCDLQEAEKRMKIKKLPNVLALHLKRFKFQEDTQKFIKLAYRVAFPFELRLFNTVDDTDDTDRLYHLYAIVIHIGAGLHSGHYISIIKTMGTWQLFDDENVSTIAEKDIPKYFGDSIECAYVLYYQATDIDLASLGFRPPVPAPASTTASSATPASFEGPPITPSSPAPLVDDLADAPEIKNDSPSPSPSIPSLANPPEKTPSKPILDISVFTQEPTHSPLASPVTVTSPKHSKGLFDIMRRSPSTVSGVEGDKLNGDVAHSFAAHEYSSAAASVSPPPEMASINGKDAGKKPDKDKDKDKEKKPGWFGRRKSARNSKSPRTDEPQPLSPISSTSHQGANSSSPSPSNGNWFKTAPHSPTAERTITKHRRPSDSGSPLDIAAFLDSGPRASTSTFGGSELLNGHSETSSKLSYAESSSRSSDHDTHGPPSSLSSPPPPTLDPPSRTSSLASYRINSSHTQLLTQRSMGNLSISSPSPLSPAPLSPGASTRPSSRSSPIKSPRDLPPVPPIPPLVSLSRHSSVGRSKHLKRPSVDFDPSLSPTNETYTLPLEESMVPTTATTAAMPSESPPPIMDLKPVRSPPNGIGTGSNSSSSIPLPPSTAGTRWHPTPSGSSNSSTSNLKRATRKLSFTAPFLGMGIGKKDKKDKDAPSSFGITTR